LNTIRLVLVWLAGLSVAFAQDAGVIVVGAVISRTGAHADLATEYERGIEVWRDEVNAAGGLLGRRVELRVLDDMSRAVQAGPLYARLIGEENVDLLIGPYGSAATLVAAAEAERARRVMINGAGPAAIVHARNPRYLFQSCVPYAAYGVEILQLAAQAGYTRLFVLARDEPATREMAEASQRNPAVYRPGTTAFDAQVEKARAADAQAWIAFGDVRDAAEMLKTFKRLDYAPALFFARGVAHPRFIALVGQDAEWSLGPAAFDPRLNAEARRFAKLYAEKWTVAPGMPAAEGYAAGTVLAAGVRSAGTLDQERLRAALAELQIDTVFGQYRVAPETGAQAGSRPPVVQIRRGVPRAGPPQLPFPPWGERTLIE
jgi:branched-chain amino acid transport system substrate-binding protein